MKKREYEFRGKRIDNGEWVYGSLQWLENKYMDIPSIEAIILQPTEYNHMTNFDPNRNKKEDWKRDWISCQVDPKTVGQHTGLKDKNGVEIFEGDKDSRGLIVKYLSKYSGYFLVNEYGSGFHLAHAQRVLKGRIKDIEIIGNIYEVER